MQDIREIEKQIEIARNALDKAINQNNKDDIYQKSILLDQLIEKYLDQKESSTSYHK